MPDINPCLGDRTSFTMCSHDIYNFVREVYGHYGLHDHSKLITCSLMTI